MSPQLKKIAKDATVALGIFFLVLVLGSAAAWFARSVLGFPTWASSLVVQLVFLCTPLAMARFLRGGRRELGLILSTSGLLHASLASIVVAIALVWAISLVPQEGAQGQPELVEDPLLLAVLTLLVAPPCEEMFFRGLLQGYIMGRGHRRLSMVLPAILFSAVHAIPFRSAGVAMLSAILVGALALGLIAGYFRAASGSLLHAVLAHFWFNVVGYIAMMI